jgi:hypothetical protein
MSTTYRTCHFFHDDGRPCNFHLNHRVRLMRMAKARARNERFDLSLPPLESMHAVQSALSQVGEALAADMIDLKRADRLIRVLTVSGRHLLRADKWPASPYHSDQPGPAVDLAAHGLPLDLNLDIPPETAYPPPDHLPGVILSGGGAPSAPPQSKDPFGPQNPHGSYHEVATPPDLSSRAEGAASASGVEGPAFSLGGDSDFDFRPDHPVTPDNVELADVLHTQGMDAFTARRLQLERNLRRRQLRLNRKRYADIAAQRNLRYAAERLAERKLAEQKAQDRPADQQPESGWPTPASVAGVEASPDAAKKPPASAATETTLKAADKAALSPTG